MQKEPIQIAVDAMGGDHAPAEIVKGAVMALENKRINLCLVGDETRIQQELTKYAYDPSRIQIVPTTEVITNEDTPTVAIKKKKDSSMVVGLKMEKEGQCAGFVSAGNTGALLTGATLLVGRIKGIERPALGTVLPNQQGYSFLVDAGANVDCKPTYLLQFAKMGAAYMESVLGVKDPKVGLVNIGAEREKGNALTKETYPLLETSGLHFIGNVEARDIPQGGVDVLVCDGFVGNVILKHSEGFATGILRMIKKELMSKTIYKMGALLSKGAFQNLKKSFEYDHLGGAPFLGLTALVVKAHGSSNAAAIKGAINQCFIAVENDLTRKIAEKL